MESNTSGAKNFFLQIGIIAALYISTISFLSFIFSLINTAFPQGSSYRYSYDGYSDQMRFAISALIVVFPLYIWLSRIYRKSVEGNPSAENKIRKWLLYLTLFLTGITIVTDLVILINSFLGGEEITTGFLLKVLSVLVVSLAIFYFYLKDIKGYWDSNQKQVKNIAYIVSALVLISIVGGFFYIGSPAEQRKRNQDVQRVNDLTSIQWQVVNYYQSKAKLPATLEDLNDPISGFIVPPGPGGEVYEYKVKAPLVFEICATFETESTAKDELNSMKTTQGMYPENIYNANWSHKAERTCFERPIDPEKYPVFEKPRPAVY